MLVDGVKISLLVERISLLYSVFVRTDKMQLVQMANIKLNDIWIENVTRSGTMFQVFNINVSYDYTTAADIDLLRHELEKFVRHPDNSRDFEPNIYLWVVSLGDLDKMQLQMLIWHKSNWHDGILTGDRNSKFISAVADALRRIPIYAPRRADILGTASNPAYMVSFSDNAAAEKLSNMEKHRETLRTVPIEPPAAYPEVPAATSAAAATAPGGFTGVPVSNDSVVKADKPMQPTTVHEGTGVSLEPQASSETPQRGDSQAKGGFRKRGETVTNPIPRESSVNLPRGGSLRSQGAHDEESQLGSITSPQQGGFLAPSMSQRSVPPPTVPESPALTQQEAEAHQARLAPQPSRRGPRETRIGGRPTPSGDGDIG